MDTSPPPASIAGFPVVTHQAHKVKCGVGGREPVLEASDVLERTYTVWEGGGYPPP